MIDNIYNQFSELYLRNINSINSNPNFNPFSSNRLINSLDSMLKMKLMKIKCKIMYLILI